MIGFAGLVAMKSDDLSSATVWTVCGIGMLLSVLLCGVLTRPGGVQLGWALQIALVASGFVVPMMFILGLVFGGLWWASVHYGRKIDEVKARWAAQEAAQAPAMRLTRRAVGARPLPGGQTRPPGRHRAPVISLHRTRMPARSRT